MILRMLTLAGALSGAAAVSQFPAFSHQYVQRLGGAVDALGEVVADFDASAAEEGLSRADALASMTGEGFVARRRADMERTIERYETLSGDLEDLRAAGPFTRAYHAAGGADGQIVTAAWGDFKPALPLNFEGAVFAGAGLFSGWLAVGGVLGVLRLVLGGLWRLVRGGARGAEGA